MLLMHADFFCSRSCPTCMIRITVECKLVDCKCFGFHHVFHHVWPIFCMIDDDLSVVFLFLTWFLVYFV